MVVPLPSIVSLPALLIKHRSLTEAEDVKNAFVFVEVGRIERHYAMDNLAHRVDDEDRPLGTSGVFVPGVEGLCEHAVAVGEQWEWQSTETLVLYAYNTLFTSLNFGYGGSGPAQLALAILYDFTEDDEIASRHYQDFKSHCVARWTGDEASITGAEIVDFLRQQDEADRAFNGVTESEVP